MNVRSRWSRRLSGFVVAAVMLGAGGVGLNRMRSAETDVAVPVAAARQGEFVVIIRCRGDVKAGRSLPIYAPIVPNLTIAWMAPEGELIKHGEPIIRFDSSSAEQQLVQKQATLTQAQASLEQALAQAQLTAERDQSDLRDARYAVETAKLNTADNEFVGRIQAEQAKLDLSIAEQKLRVQEANIALHAATDRSKIASVTRQRDLARAEVELTKTRIGHMQVVAPITGYVVFGYNYNQGFEGQQFKVGDNVFSGMKLAEMPDMDSLVMDAKVEEIDRGRIATGHQARVRIDALPEMSLEAAITTISPLTEPGNEWPITRSFRAYAALQRPDPRLRPGMNGSMDIVVNRIPNAIGIPAKAVFTHDGKPVVYVSRGDGYSAVEVQLLARNPDEVAVSGIPAGAKVALADPEKRRANP